MDEVTLQVHNENCTSIYIGIKILQYNQVARSLGMHGGILSMHHPQFSLTDIITGAHKQGSIKMERGF